MGCVDAEGDVLGVHVRVYGVGCVSEDKGMGGCRCVGW